ncbi:MAG: threonine synthase, partial [Okeania sp. SIO2H7]|nr:threonine synthase [Okeania sp. SIO2H7]
MTQATNTDSQIHSQNTAIETLKCKECGEEYPLEAKHICEDVCFGPLEVKYDYEKLSQTVSRATIEAGPNSIWRYRQFLPVKTDNVIDVGTGMTPLLKSER